MWATLIVCIIIIAIVYYQTFTQGLFSSLIMMVASLAAALTALNYYEIVSVLLARWGLASLGTQTIAIMAIFCLSLLLLRELTDRLIRGNMIFPMIIDRVGSAIFSLITSLTITGMILIALQLSSVPATFLGFNRFASAKTFDSNIFSNDPETLAKNLFPPADTFILSVMNRFSDYSCAGQEESFRQVHPHMLTELYLNRLTPKDFVGMRHHAAPDAVNIENIWLVKHAVRYKAPGSKKETILKPAPGEVFIAVKIYVKPGTDKRGDSGARDADNAIRFAYGQIRMVGYNPSDRHITGQSHYPLGVYNSGGQSLTGVTLDEGKYFAPGKNAKITLLFSWPENIKKTPPQFVEFKCSSRTKIDLGSLLKS